VVQRLADCAQFSGSVLSPPLGGSAQDMNLFHRATCRPRAACHVRGPVTPPVSDLKPITPPLMPVDSRWPPVFGSVKAGSNTSPLNRNTAAVTDRPPGPQVEFFVPEFRQPGFPLAFKPPTIHKGLDLRPSSRKSHPWSRAPFEGLRIERGAGKRRTSLCPNQWVATARRRRWAESRSRDLRGSELNRGCFSAGRIGCLFLGCIRGLVLGVTMRIVIDRIGSGLAVEVVMAQNPLTSLFQLVPKLRVA